MPLGPWAGQEQGSQPPRHRGCWRINTFLSRNERVRFGIIDSVYKRHSSAWKRQRVTMQFQYKACFDCSFFPAFLSTCYKNRQTFTNESLSLKFSYDEQLCWQYQWKMQGTWFAFLLEIGFTCVTFFLVTKAKLPPPRKTHECTREVCTVCLLQCTTLCAVSWGIELGFELELVSRSNENFSLGCVLFFSRGLYVHGAI